MAERIDALLKFFDEHAIQARRHEDQRERMTTLVLVISGALVALIGQSTFSAYTLPAAVIIILIGFYGWVFSKKHYERNQLHVETVREIRDEIDRELEVLPWPERDGTRLLKRSLGTLRNDADERHYKEFPRPAKTVQLSANSSIARSRLHRYWEGLHLVVIIIGVVLASIILIKSQFPTSLQGRAPSPTTTP